MMSDLKRQMSWHEDFARNLSRFFSRNKSADSEGNGSEVREADGSAVSCSAERDPDQTPEKLLDPAQEDPSQESQSSDVPDGNTASQTEDGSGGDARDSAPSSSTVPPADGFLRRLGSLFHFSRTEPAGAQRERRSDADSSSLTTTQRDTQTSAETLESRGGAEPRDPALTAETSLCHSEHTHTPSEEQSEEDRRDAVNIDAKESLEDRRRFDLACPPVVTYGTYRGSREVRKPKKKHRVELHSPISEGEEATQPDGHEDSEISSCAVNTMSTESQEYPTAVNQASPSQDTLAQSVLSDRVPAVESELTPSHTHPHVADHGPLLSCIETEQSPPKDPVNRGQVHLALSATPQTLSEDNADLTASDTNTDHHQTQSSEPALTVDRTDDLVPGSQACWTLEEFELKQTVVDFGMDDKVLQLESKKMVDSILTNALAALHKMEASEMEHDVMLTCDPNKGSEAVLCEGSEDCGDGGTNAERQFGVVLTDQVLSAVLEETLAGSCSLVDCSRSPPSSGYESIAGSDTDIRCVVGVASDVTTASAPVGSQNENQDALEYLFEEKNLDGTASRKSSGRNSVLSAAADEPLSPNLHSLHKTDIKLLSEESLWQEQHTGDVSVCEAEWVRGEKRPQGTAKDNAMSNNCQLSLNGSSGTSGTAPSAHQESLQQSQTLSVMGKSDPVSHSLVSDTADADMMSEITQSHTPEKTECSDEQEQICRVSQAGIDSHVLPSVTEVDHPSQWATVQAFRCDVTDDQSLSPATLKEHFSVNQADAGTSLVSVSGRRIHLDPVDSSSRTAAVVPQHSRSHDLDLHQLDGGFAIISEEEESDMVFVNDMGPIHSPSTRRAKAYPFSLSPIYEEEFGREEASGQQTLQVPPVTEEEQRSVEQPASSILSLLQSVSEKLQSSVVSSSVEQSVHAAPSRDDSEDDDEDSSIPQSRQLIEAKPEHETAHDTPDRIQEERECDDTLLNIGKNTNTPFYQYLKSGILPSGDGEPEDSKQIVCRSAGNTTVTGEIGGFGKVNPRPAAVLVYESQSLSAQRRDICHDVEDAGRDLFAHRGTLHALRGCWLLYVDSWFRGSCVLLEEGQTVTSGGSQQDLKETSEPCRTDVSGALTVGSIRTLLKDGSVPEIHLYPSSSQTVHLHSASDLTGAPVLLSDLCVRTGCWLVYEQPGFSGRSAVLETDGRVTPLLQNSLLSCVKSLRPLEMGGLQVSRPLDLKVVVFEKPWFQGGFRELLDHAPHLTNTAASLRVTGGIWVAFSSEGFTGHQCVLEEGEYTDCSRLFGGTELWIQSLRCVQTDFLEPAVSLKMSDEDMDVHQEIPDLQEIHGLCVKSGAWVAYSERCFTGQQYVLEKGHYPGLLDWGDGRSSARSLRPIHREVCRIAEPKFLLRVYCQTQYSGQSREFESGVPDCAVPGVASLRVIRGSWLLFDEECYSGNQYILGEGHYPDLTSCGCTSTAIKSLKPIPYSFAEPSVSVFSLSGFEGLEDSLCSDAEDMSHFFIQSVRVHSGLWVAYEYARFRGRQMLLQPGGYALWAEHSGWDTIGSLKPLRQPKAYIQLRSRARGSVLTSENLPDGSFPAKLFLSPADRSLDTQRWIFTHGLLKNTARRGCLSVIGAKACAGAPVALWEEHGRINQRWSLNEDGSICSHLNRSLVLDLRGGCGPDRDHLILSPLHADSATQTWDIDVL
ncbi:beta/gamma crystallin domain-containing protein 3 isoform X2 [Carassius gibelio]|uniref:beta/gamma crystallin domain-containing protein 3 isoform X2 n=1 Tax=Carassius gibelio TaxID=101364 RepID=UPI002279AB7B|nr:beta/gamma crystallin domain-containing protein 3 isoform X2 [Carassius gibelio]